eukprot:13285977-Alexandrium_andersonii.AAC.1
MVRHGEGIVGPASVITWLPGPIGASAPGDRNPSNTNQIAMPRCRTSGACVARDAVWMSLTGATPWRSRPLPVAWG